MTPPADLLERRRLAAARQIMRCPAHQGHLWLLALLDVEIGIDREGEGE